MNFLKQLFCRHRYCKYRYYKHKCFVICVKCNNESLQMGTRGGIKRELKQ